MADLFWAFWDVSLRFALFGSVLLLLHPLLKRGLPANWLCWAWALLVIRLLFPISLPFSGSVFNISERFQPSTWTEALRSGVVNAGWGETLIPILRTQDELVKSSLVGVSWEQVLVAVWLAGIAFLALRLLACALRLRCFFERAERLERGRLHAVFKDVRHRFGIHANVPLLVSRDVGTPGIAGIFNPRVILPGSIATGLSEEEARCVLLHELTHYKRGDLFLHHLLLLSCFIHWYNPLAWLAFRRFKASMEQACDADVLNTESITTPREYGMTLLGVMRRCRSVAASPVGSLGLLGNREQRALKERIQMIACPRRVSPLCAMAAGGLFAASFVYSITTEADLDEEGERLLGLTRFGAPGLFPRASSPKFRDVSAAWEDSEYKRPNSWVQELDASKYRGREVRVVASLAASSPQGNPDFWVVARDEEGEFVSSRYSGRLRERRSGLWQLEVRLGLSSSAQSLDCALSVERASGLRFESFEVHPVEPLQNF